MKKVKVKDAGIKINNRWYFKDEEVIIDDNEYEKNKEYLIVLENLKEKNERVIEIVVEDETVDIEQLKSDIEEYVKEYNKNIIEDNIDNVGTEGDEPTLKELRMKAMELGIDASRMTNKENILKKINEVEAPKFGETSKIEDTEQVGD